MRRPLAVFGLSFLAAQWLLIAAPLAGFLPAALLAFVWILCTGRRGYPRLVFAAGMLAFGLLALYALFGMLPARLLSGREVNLRLRIEQCESSYGDGVMRGEARVLEMDGEQSRLRVLFEELPDSEEGEIIEGRFVLRDLEDDGWRTSHYADGIFLRAEYQGGFRFAGQVTGWRAAILTLRKRLNANLIRYLPTPCRGILKAMVLGQKETLTAGQQQVFRTAGISHILVVSGLHLSVVSGLLSSGSVWSRRLRRTRAAGAMLLTLLLMAVTGFGRSVCRAGVAALVYQFGVIFFLPADPVTSLGLAALLLGLQNPFAAGDAGLQLSVCATLGVLFAGRAAKRFLARSPVRGRAGRWLNRAAEGLFPSLFAVLFTLPVQLWNGFAVSGAALPANLATLWLAKPLLLCGLGCAVLGFAPPLAPLQRACSFGAGLLASLLEGIASALARLPFATLALHRGYALFVYGCLFLLAVWAWRAGCFGRFWLAAPGILAAAVFCANLLSRDVLELTLVGNSYNPCAVILQQGGAAVLLRGGSANARAVSRYLAQRGIRTPALLVDLRAEPGDDPLAAQKTLRLEDLPQNRPVTETFGPVSLLLWNGGQGNLALLEADGYTAAISSGRQVFACDLPVDLFLAGPGAPGSLRPRAVLTLSRAYPWLDQLPEDCRGLTSNTDPSILLRPGCSVTYKEVQDAVQ